MEPFEELVRDIHTFERRRGDLPTQKVWCVCLHVFMCMCMYDSFERRRGDLPAQKVWCVFARVYACVPI